jgi:hypothetical protein
MGIAAVLLALMGLGTGLWLTHSEPTVTLVVGTPVAVSIDGGEMVRDRRFIAKLLHDVNGNPPYPPSVSSCPSGGLREYALLFEYADGDRLTIQVRTGCGVIAIAGYAPATMARASQALVDDIDNAPMASP